jgi:hypothetical protein
MTWRCRSAIRVRPACRDVFARLLRTVCCVDQSSTIHECRPNALALGRNGTQRSAPCKQFSSPQFQSAVALSPTNLQILGGLTCTCKLSSRACGPRNPMKIVQIRAIINDGSGEIDSTMEQPRPLSCLIRSVRDRANKWCVVLPLWERR